LCNGVVAAGLLHGRRCCGALAIATTMHLLRASMLLAARSCCAALTTTATPDACRHPPRRTERRTKAYGLFVSANWASNLLVSSFTLSAIDALGGGACGVARLYLVFAAVSAGAFCFVYARVRETMGVSLEDLNSGTFSECRLPLARKSV
jgi:Sugar (and other) transporter